MGKEPSKMRIFVDDREEMNSLIEKRLESLKENFEIERKRLEVGDILYPEKSIIVEVKDVNDFYGSIKDGRIFSQALNMKNNYQNCYVMIVGNWDKLIKDVIIGRKKGGKGSLNPHEVVNILHQCQGAIESLDEKYHVKVKRCDSPAEFSYRLKLICEKLGETPSPKDIVKMDFTFEQRYISVFTAICGIGSIKAKAIASKYKNLKMLCNATEEELKTIDGIGPKLAKEVMNFVNGNEK